MLTTAELRWFKRGPLPPEILNWFQQNCLSTHPEPPEEREDLYLYYAGCNYLGIKLRQGRLEIKWRNAELGIKRFGNSIEGKVEKWSKWLCEDPTGQSFQPSDVIKKAEWLTVKKERQQCKYQVLKSRVITSVPVSESIDEGCNVELTKLSINGEAWWSLAFEAFSKEDSLVEYLQAVASWVFETYNGSKLQAENSYGYPKWLSLVV